MHARFATFGGHRLVRLVYQDTCGRQSRTLTACHAQILPQKKQQRQASLTAVNSTPFDLTIWRRTTSDLRRHWGESGAEEATTFSPFHSSEEDAGTLATWAVKVLNTAEPQEKIALTHRAWATFCQGGMPVGRAVPPDDPARPERPQRVPSKQIPKAKVSGLPLNVYTLHNLAHVELNAIDLAWDTVARFSGSGMPDEFFCDFAHVAEDESRHLGWCLQRLGELGHSYGDMVAHNMLWDGAQKSAGDIMGRLVVVPCSQEARGLDAGPRLVERLMSWADHRSAAIVDRICKEELAHVSVGTFWFRELCAALDADAGDQFRAWLAALCPDLLSGQFNHTERARAGLQQNWYDGKLWPEGLLPGRQESGQGADLQRLSCLPRDEVAQVLKRLTYVLGTETSMT